MSNLEDDLLIQFLEQGKQNLIYQEALRIQKDAMVSLLALMELMNDSDPKRTEISVAYAIAKALTEKAYRFCEEHHLL